MTVVPMFVLAALVIFAISVTAFLVFRDWRSSRTPTKQLPPDIATKRWLNREARNARQNDRETTRKPFGT